MMIVVANHNIGNQMLHPNSTCGNSRKLPPLRQTHWMGDGLTRAIRQSIAATHHLLQLIQPQLEDKARRKLSRLSQRLLNIDHELDHLTQK
jgi:hypothetical protein